jgi:hypothetical protein
MDGMGRSQRSRTRQCVGAVARVALAFGRPPLGAHGAVPQPEPPADRLLIQLGDAAAIPRATTPTAASPTDRIEALAIRTATPMRYVRTLLPRCGYPSAWRGGPGQPGGAAGSDADRRARDPTGGGQGHLDPVFDVRGGGADAPWWILTLVAAGVIRASGEQAA